MILLKQRTSILSFLISFSPSQALNVYDSVSNELESALLWINNGLEFVTFPAAYFASEERKVPKELGQHISLLENTISEGINKTMDFFLKVNNALLGEHCSELFPGI